MSKLVWGVGINDADYVIKPTVCGKQINCAFYTAWQNLLKRCYNLKYQEIKPTYKGCSVTEDWHRFMSFKSWMEKQGWQGKELDKDLLFTGNKVYAPDKCVFVDSVTNNFILDRSASRGFWPMGVRLVNSGKFSAACGNPINGRYEHLGVFDNPEKAHQAWRKRKHEIACHLAELQTDIRAAAALRSRYA